jgi:hypothetical protein
MAERTYAVDVRVEVTIEEFQDLIDDVARQEVDRILQDAWDRTRGGEHTASTRWHFEVPADGEVTDVTEPEPERCTVQHGDWTGPHIRISSCPEPGAYDPHGGDKHRFYEEN